MVEIIKKIISNNLVICIAVFLISFTSFTGTMYFFYTTDSLPNNFTALNLIFKKRIDLQNYKKTINKKGPMNITIENWKGVVFSKTPPLMGILSVPTFWVLNKYYGVKYLTEDQIVNTDYSQLIGKLSASFYCSLSAVLMFLILLKLSKNKWPSFLMTLVYFLCTNIFNTASQANFQHGISLFLINLFLLIFISNPNRVANLITAGLIAGLFTQLRISNGFYVVFTISYFFLQKDQIKTKIDFLTKFFLGFFVVYAAVLVAYYYYQIPNGYGREYILSIQHFTPLNFIENTLAVLFSFNYGLFFFSPILLLSFIPTGQFIKKSNLSEKERIMLSLSSTLLIFIIFVSFWWAWAGGRSLNARLLIESLPAIIILLGYSFQEYNKYLIYRILFYTFFLVSFSINILTTYCIDPTISWYDYFTVHDPQQTILTHKYEIRNAWYYKPAFLVYVYKNFMKTKSISILTFYRKNSHLIFKNTVYRPSLKHLTINKIFEKETIILNL